MTCFLALDQSTSATKALLFDQQGRLLDKESREHTQHYPQPGRVEHDAEEIWQNVLLVLHTLLARHTDKNIVSLSLTNQRETVVIFDRATGEPRYPAIVWQCRRSVAICEEHARHESLIQQRTGLRLDAYFSASKIQWLIRHHPELHAKLETGEALIRTNDCYLIYRLTNGAVFSTDHTNACRTLLFDIGQLYWDEDLCALFDVPMKALPEVRECAANFGETTLEGKTLPICGVTGDSQAALFAQRCFVSGTAKVTFGTGSSILLNIGSHMQPAPSGVVTTLAWVLNGTPTYAFEGIVISSAATLTWLRDQLGVFRDFDEIEPLALAVPDNEGVYLVPAFSGLGLPHWQPAARATMPECSALGAALAGMLGMGVYQSLAELALAELAALPQAETIYQPALPDAPNEKMQRYYAGWQQAVSQTLHGIKASALLLVAASLLLTSCKLWTVRPIGWQEKKVATQQLDTAAYVESVWQSKIVPTVKEKAVDLATRQSVFQSRSRNG